jgi:hypothetical protein
MRALDRSTTMSGSRPFHRGLAVMRANLRQVLLGSLVRYVIPRLLIIWDLTLPRRLLRRLLHLDLGDVPSADSRTLTVELLRAWHIGLAKPR